jgi:isoleucyl-tRNA synthetase
MAISTLLFHKSPYENVIVLGHVQDENGQKMSKSKGNAVDPFDALEQYGADAIRWYFYINSAPWLPNRFHGKAVSEYSRRFMGTLWNTYAFYVLYANIDSSIRRSIPWSTKSSRLWTVDTLKTVLDDPRGGRASGSDYQIPEAARTLESFVDDMSNWYVRRCRPRFWAKGMEQDKINAYMTLYTCLVEFCKAAAPMIPFMTEDIYQNLVRTLDGSAPESIHLCDWPEVKENWIDQKLEEDMSHLLEIVVLGRAARNKANLKNRQPLAHIYVKSDFELTDFYQAIILR